MIRRGLWLVTGVAVGAGGTIWSRRRVSQLADRARQGQVAGDVLRVLENGSRRLQRRLGVSLQAGVAQAQRREEEMRRSLQVR